MNYMSNVYDLEERNPFTAGEALESFRSHDFDSISSICEIIDNSVQANATEIDIKFDWAENPDDDEGARYAKQFVFIDNGDGMDEKILYDYLILGESNRRTLPHGIGKFGVGATLSGISIARHIDAYSKVNGGKWMYTCLDMDLIKKGKYLPKPIQKDPPTELNHGMDHGTIIIWNNIDKITLALKEDQVFEIPAKKPTELHDEDCLTTEVGRIYRKYITKTKLKEGKIVKNEKQAIIKIQDKKVEPYDPLYATYNPKQDDKEEPKIRYKVYPIRFGSYSGKMHVTTSYLPDSWWVDQYRPGIDAENLKRKIGNRLEGISLVREGREILFGKIPYFWINDPGSERGSHSFLEQDRFTSFEIEFGRDVDEIFGIQVNKSKLNVRKEVRRKISTEISPTIVSRREEWHKKRGAKGRGKTGPEKSPGKKKIQSVIDPKYDTEQKKYLKKVAEKYVKDKNDKKAIDEAFDDLMNGYLPIASYDLLPNGPFVSYAYEIDSIVVKYNMNHPFFKKFTTALGEIGVKLGKNADQALDVPENLTIRTLLDILFVSFGHALVSYDNLTKSQEIQTTLNSLQNTWADRANGYSRKDLESTQD